VSKVDPETGHFNPFPTYPFTGSLRPVYPLSEKRQIPKSIPHPEWSETGMPNYPYVKRNNVAILDQKGIAAMRKVCRLSREVLDIAAAAIKPGVTTDYIDEIVHQACIERKVSRLLQKWTWLILLGLSLSAELQSFPQITLHFRQRSHLPRYT
jgi:methionyl aminopeptidase